MDEIQQNEKSDYLKFATFQLKENLALAAFVSEADFVFASCKYNNFKKISLSEAKKITSKIPVWYCGCNTLEELNKSEKIDLKKKN